MIPIAHKSSALNTPNFGLAEQLFGDDFEVWAQDCQWHRIKTMGHRWEHLSVEFYVKLIQRLQDTAGSSQVQFSQLDDNRALCLIPLEDPQSVHKAMVALSIVDRTPDSIFNLAQRATSAAVVQQKHTRQVQNRLRELDSRVAAYSTRIDRGEGELAWLHGLADRAVAAGTENDSRTVAQSILPEMCRLINARTVAFVPCSDDDNAAAVDIWQNGEVAIAQEACLALIKEHGGAVDAVVHNYDAPAFRNSDCAGVLSCVVKTVVSSSGTVGWILAINKDLQDLATSTVTRGSVQQQCGFGIFEASLVDAAANAISAHARNCLLMAEKEAFVDGTIRLLVNAIDAKDSYTAGHSDRVAMYARHIAETMQQSEEFCDQIYLTGLVHDVGKIGVPDSVLQKPGKLTEEEFESIKLHPVTGHAILQHLADFSYVLPGVLHHHEAVDGSGYPDGLKQNEIPLQARILAVADAYDAMTSDRPYRDGMPTEKAEAIIANGAGSQWDKDCVKAFQNCIDKIHGVACDRSSRLVPRPHYIDSDRQEQRSKS